MTLGPGLALTLKTFSGQRTSHPLLVRLLNVTNVFCEGVGLPMYTANLILYQDAIQG